MSVQKQDNESQTAYAIRVIAYHAWLLGHAAGVEYQADGWNADQHDPEGDSPYSDVAQAAKP